MLWWFGAALLLAVGLVFELGLLVYAMYVLLLIMFLSRILARTWIENLSASREMNRDTAEIGDKVAVIVRIRNTGGIGVPWLIAEDSLPAAALQQRPPRLKVTGYRAAIRGVGGRGETTLLYQLDCQMRGYYQIGPLLLESGDLFGLHRRFKVVTEPGFLMVLPQVVPLDGYTLASKRPIGEVRITHRLFEDPTRINGVREYQAGDPMNRVHWRATARTGVMHSKTYEPSSVAGMTLLLDFHIASYPAQGEPHRSELAVTTCASLAHAIFTLGEQIGLATNARDAADRIRQEGPTIEFRTRSDARSEVGMRDRSTRLQPVQVNTSRGPDQLIHILETLARAELTDGLTMSQLINEVSSRLPRDATVVAVLSTVSEETAIALGNLRRQGYSVTAMVVLAEEHDFRESASLLAAERIDVRQVEDVSSIATLCQMQMLGSS